MNKVRFFSLACAGIAALLVVDAGMVYLHDLDHASDLAKENSFLKLGHFTYAWIEDTAAIVLLGLAVLLNSSSWSKVELKNGIVNTCLALVTLLLLVECFSLIGVVCAEDQTKLSTAGCWARVLAVGISAICSIATICCLPLVGNDESFVDSGTA
jgi:hypothetical protein